MARMSLSMFALSLALSSQAFTIPSSLQVAKRDFNVLEDGVVFSGPNQDDLFVAVTIGDSVVPVQLDLESSDLWISGNLNQAYYQPVSARTSLPATPVSARVGLAGVNLTQQFYYSAQAPQGWASPPPSLDVYGRMGLGPTSSSQLVKDANDGSHSIIDQLILQEGSEPFITLLVSPLETDKGNSLSFNGLFTAGTTVDLTKVFSVSADRLSAVGVPVLSKVTSQPKLQLGSNGTFSVDDIQVSGKSVGLISSVSGAQTLGKLSTTNPWIVAPKSVVDAVYSGVQGASYSTSDRLYHLPCSAEVSVNIIVTGVSYPINPMDVISTQVGSDSCVGTFQASDGSSQGYDVLMGLPFLRNAYTLYGYGNSDGNTLSSPYYQFLPTSTQSESHVLFVQVRAPAPAPTPAPAPAPSTITVFTTTTHHPTTTVWIGAPAGYTGPPTTNNDLAVAGSLADNDTTDKNLPTGGIGDQLRHCLPAIIVLFVVLGLTGIGATTYCLVARRHDRKVKPSAYRNLHTAEAGEPVHVPLYGAEEKRDTTRYSDPYKDEN